MNVVNCLSIKLKKEEIIRLLIASALLLTAVLVSLNTNSYKVVFFLLICMNLYCAFYTRDNNALFIVYLFLMWCNYSIYIFFWTDRIQKYLLYKYFVSNPAIMRDAAFSLFVFSTVLFIFCPNVRAGLSNHSKQNGEKKRSIIVGKRTSKIMTYIVLLCIVLISGWSMSIRIKHGYMPSSALYEYIYIFFIVAFYLSAGNKKLDILISSLIIINCIYVFFNGARIAAVQFALVFFLRFFMHTISKRLMLIGIIGAIIGLNAIGMWRGFTDFNLGYFLSSLKYLFSTNLTLDTAYAAEASGMCTIRLIQDYSVLGRLRLFAIYLAYVILGSKAFGVESNLTVLTQQSYDYATGGGTLPTYGLFYLGYLGVFLVALLVSYYLKMLGNYEFESSDYKRCLAAFIFASLMRWYLYSPAPLLRGALLFSIVFFLTTSFRIKE